jgi:hypothetical protein
MKSLSLTILWDGNGTGKMLNEFLPDVFNNPQLI